MNDMGMRRHAARVDQRIKASLADLATAFHAPEGGGAADRGENRELRGDLHIGDCEEKTWGLCEG